MPAAVDRRLTRPAVGGKLDSQLSVKFHGAYQGMGRRTRINWKSRRLMTTCAERRWICQIICRQMFLFLCVLKNNE